MTPAHPPTVSQDKPSLMKSAGGKWIVSLPDQPRLFAVSWEAGLAAILTWWKARGDGTGYR